MMKTRLVATFAAFAFVGIAASVGRSSSSAPPILRYADVQPDARLEARRDVTLEKPDPRPILRTQDFENGQVTLKKVESARLERFLQDLNQRRDFDRSQHNGKPGPSYDYLTTWIGKTMDELAARGYTIGMVICIAIPAKSCRRDSAAARLLNFHI